MEVPDYNPQLLIDKIHVIHRAGQRLQELLTPESLAQEIISVLEDIVTYEFGAVLLIEHGSGRLVPFALSEQGRGRTFVDLDKAYVESKSVRVGRGITGWVAMYGQCVRVGDVRRDPRYLAVRTNIRSELCVPLKVHDAIIGVLNVETTALDAYSSIDQIVLETVASQIAIAIHNADLYKQINDRTMMLERQIEERQRLEEQLYHAQKIEAIGLLAGGIAHDFNNILSVILGYSDMLLQEGARLDAGRRSDLEQIKLAGERAAMLTRQLLTFSRRQILQPTLLDLNSALADLSKMLLRLIGEDVKLVLNLADNVPAILVDEGQLQQVIMNLAINARDAMTNGGTLTMETASVVLDAAYAQLHLDVTPGWYVMLTVSDTGHGMDAQTRSRIFEPFFTTKPAGKGTGMGLATVYGIVRQSGGHIWCESDVMHGTTFKIYFPYTDQTVSRSESAVLASRGVVHETILLVEDEPMVRELAQRILEGEGYRVWACANAPDALALVAKADQGIDLLLTDVVMPGGMSGRELADHLTARFPVLKVLYMSGYTNHAIDHQRVLDAGVSFLYKPFVPDALLRKVREILDRP